MSFVTLYEPFHVHTHHRHLPFHHHHYHPYQRQVARRGQQAYDVFDALARQQASLLDAFDDIFSGFEPAARAPSVDLKEDGNDYVIEAELPGVRKEDLDVTIGEGGKTITIEGKVFKREGPAEGQQQALESAGEGSSGQSPAGETTTEKPAAEGEAAPSQTAMEVDRPADEGETIQSPAHTERTYSSVFSRTFSLPHAVDGSRVSAKLLDGVLTLRVPKVEDSKTMRITVD